MPRRISPALDGGQAQFVPVPKTGGILFDLDDSSSLPKDVREKALIGLADSSLLLLTDILPTGVYATLNLPKAAPVLTGKPWPLCFNQSDTNGNEIVFTAEYKVLTVAIIGLDPVGVCAAIGMLDALTTTPQVPFRIVAVDPLETRKEKMKAIYAAVDEGGKGTSEFLVLSIEREGQRMDCRDWVHCCFRGRFVL